MTIGAAILAAALLLNGIPWGAGLLLPLLLLLAPRRSARCSDRSAVRLALRLAKGGERTLLVESAEGVRVARVDEAGRGLQFVGALANGALILARRR